MPTALISIGSNLGDRLAIAEAALASLNATPGVRIVRRSAWRETAPVGGPAGQGAFLNGALLLETSLSPDDLLRELQRIEHEAGRRRQIRWEARPLDLDLLLYDELQASSPTLTLPHPRMTFRRFVLEPAADVAPELRHPVVGETVQWLLDRLNRPPRYFAIAGPPGSGRNRLVERALKQRPGLKVIPRPAAFDVGSPGASASPPSPVEIASELGRIVRILQQTTDRTPVVSPFFVGQTLAQTLQLNMSEQERIHASLPASDAYSLRPLAVIQLSAPSPNSAADSKAVDAEARLDRDFLLPNSWWSSSPFCRSPVLPMPGRDEGGRALMELLAAIDASL